MLGEGLEREETKTKKAESVGVECGTSTEVRVRDDGKREPP